MQTSAQARANARADGYRERLSPSLWALVAAALAGPMVALVVAPLDTTLSLVAGAVAGVGVVVLFIAASPVVTVRGDVLTAGRAHIHVGELGAPEVMTGPEARLRRGPGLDARAWHLFRGGIEGLVILPVDDPEDPVTEWVISSRTPDRLAAAVRRAQLRLRTPRR